MRNSNLQKIYENVLCSSQLIGHKRHLVLEYNSKQDVKDAIINKNPNLRAGSDKRGAIRLQPVNKVVDREKYIEDFFNTLSEIDLIVTDIIKSGPGAPSSKFDSYVVKGKNNKEFIITLGGGFNKGQEFEKIVIESIKEYFDKLDDDEPVEKPAFLEKLEDNLEVRFANIKKGPSKVERSLSDKGADDAGEVIADFVLITEEGDKYYISLKNTSGITVSNNGASGMFDKDNDRVTYKGNDRNNNSKKIFEAANVDIDRVVEGLNDYVNQQQSVPGQEDIVDTTSDADLDQLYKFLLSGFDYGYIYVKEKKADGLEVVDLTTPDKLKEFLGEIKEVRVKYPYFRNATKSRKNVSIMLETDNAAYSFDIRNSKGGDIPNQINLVRSKSKKEVKAAKASISALTPEEQILDRITNI